MADDDGVTRTTLFEISMRLRVRLGETASSTAGAIHRLRWLECLVQDPQDRWVYLTNVAEGETIEQALVRLGDDARLVRNLRDAEARHRTWLIEQAEERRAAREKKASQAKENA